MNVIEVEVEYNHEYEKDEDWLVLDSETLEKS